MKKILFFDIRTKIRASVGFKPNLTSKCLNKMQLEYQEYEELPDEDDGFVSTSLEDYIIYEPEGE